MASLIFGLLSAGKLGDVDLAASGQAHGDHGEELGCLTAGRDADGAFRADKLSDDDHVDDIVQLLDNVRRQQGEHERQELPENVALSQIHAILLGFLQSDPFFK